ncbi:putative endonuclease LCL3 [Vanrija pseudolonga]|uniref:Probable endonuclease LCL3 n=1 Tax=Vanrija pseudolonga TaxID=143232 RepID=A0AAF1BQR5_9TREE|nr:putative endonuclease LCL3 [Vanrija pseudolonga]
MTSSTVETAATTTDDRVQRIRWRTPSASASAASYPARSPLESIKAYLPAGGVPTSLPPWAHDPATVAALSASLAVLGTLGGVRVYRRFFKRIRNADSLSTAVLDKKPFIKGVVTRVGDGDNFRLYHTPGPFWRYPLKLRRVPSSPKELKDNTLSIRIAGVDAPENAHFGNPAQPYAKEALDWLTKAVLGKRMKCQLLRKDQYNRIVAVPYIVRPILPNKPLPLMMLKEGTAVVYTSGGAEYGPWGLEGLQKAEDDAKRNRRGLWAAKKVELPKDYKKRVKEGGDLEEVSLGRKPGFWERLGRWLGGKT